MTGEKFWKSFIILGWHSGAATNTIASEQAKLNMLIVNVCNVHVCTYRTYFHLSNVEISCNIITWPINTYWWLVRNPISISYELRMTAIAGDENHHYGEKQRFGTRRCVFLTLTRREQQEKCEQVTVKLPLRHSSLPPLLSLLSVSSSSCVAFSSLASRLHLQPLPPLIVAKDYDRAQLSCFTASHESYLKCHWSWRRAAALVPVIAQQQTKGFDQLGFSSCLAKRFLDK